MKFLLLIIPVLIYGESLKSLVEFATQHSDLVLSKTLTKKAKSSDVNAKESAYYPTIDVGAFYQTLNERTALQAGDVYSGYAKIGFDIYDGGKKLSLLSQSKHEYKASRFDWESTKKSLSLEIVQIFFNIKSLESTLKAKEEAKKSLEEQLKRTERFFRAKLATEDDVQRLQAAFDTNIYDIDALKFEIVTLRKTLELKVGKSITTLENSKLIKFKELQRELSDGVKVLMAQKDALMSGAESLSSIYYPQLKIEDSFSVYGYDRSDAMHPKGVKSQNKLLLSLNLRLFDKGVVQKSKEALVINSQALNSQMVFKKKEQKMQYELAVLRIQTNRAKIKSAKSALVAASSAYATISRKYSAGIVDNVVYLDALSAKTDANALYESSLNDLEIAYATYYYHAGKNIEEFLQ